MALPKLPDFESGRKHKLRAALKTIVAYLRAITPIVGGDVTPHFVAGGAMLNGGAGGGGGLIPMLAPAGGILGGGSAVCTFRKLSGTTLVVDTGNTEVVSNDFDDDVAPGAKIWCTRFGGLLFVVIEACT